jgi:2',3'-cyclic-nucleotide 2'-phosphodiesterase (5'-nucleotidase family)
MSSRFTSGLRFAVLFVLLAGLALPLTTAEAEPPAVTMQFLNVSDWHGQIDPLASGVGGASVISTYWKQDRLNYPNSTFMFTAGDTFGATPPLSNFFEEKPAVLALRMMGVKISTLGNHEFDRGINHLQEMIDLAGQKKGQQPGKPYRYVTSNLKNRNKNLDDVRGYQIYEIGGLKVAVIGVTNPDAPTLVFPGSFGTMETQDPAQRALKARAKAAEEGAKVFIVILHMGVTGFDGGGQPFGPLVDFANSVNGFHVIFGDHTDIEYGGIINNQLVVENRSKGATYARTLLTVKSKTGLILNRSFEFVEPVAANVTPDQAIEDVMQPYRDELKPIYETQIGQADMVIPRADACGNSAGRTCESKIGNLITDAMRNTYETDFAFTNSGGIRANLTCPTTDLPNDFCPSFIPPPFPITRGQAQEVLPFGNVVVTLEMTGAELKTALENGVSAMPGVNGRFPQVSGLCFTYDIHAAAGSRVTSAVRQAEDGSCTGTAVDLSSSATYEIAQNDFTANGGDGYPNVASRMTTRDVMVNVVADYIGDNSPVNPLIEGRITCTTSGATPCPTVTP